MSRIITMLCLLLTGVSWAGEVETRQFRADNGWTYNVQVPIGSTGVCIGERCYVLLPADGAQNQWRRMPVGNGPNIIQTPEPPLYQAERPGCLARRIITTPIRMMRWLFR